jgi:hypothetical protein
VKRLGLIRTAGGEDYECGTPWPRMRLENVRLLVEPRPGERVLYVGSAARRPGFFPVLRTLERLAGSRVELLGYRICLRGRL